MRIWGKLIFLFYIARSALIALPIDPPTLNFASLELAPLIPLEPQFPLELTHLNRELYIDNPQLFETENEKLRKELEAHSFPWLSMVFLLTFLGLTWMGYITRDYWLRFSKKSSRSLPKLETLAEAWQALQKKSLNQGNLQGFYDALESILKRVLQEKLKINIKQPTNDEISRVIKKQNFLSAEQTSKVLTLLKQMDLIKFAGEKPSHAEINQMTELMESFGEL